MEQFIKTGDFVQMKLLRLKRIQVEGDEVSRPSLVENGF
jgi:hypothetical protein